MRLLPDVEQLAEGLSAFIRKGGWLVGPLGGMAMLYLLQDKLVFNPVKPAKNPQSKLASNKTSRG